MASVQPAEHAVSGVVARLEQPLLRYATRILRDPEVAREVVQDTFLKLWEQRQREAEEGVERPVDKRLESWLFTVCRNRAIDIKRRGGRVLAFEQPPELPVEPNGEQRCLLGEVFEAVDELPEKQRRVLELRYGQHRSYRQIGESEGMSLGYVAYVLNRAVGTVRSRFVVGVVLLLAGWGAYRWWATPEPLTAVRVMPAPALETALSELASEPAAAESGQPAASPPPAASVADGDRKRAAPPAPSGSSAPDGAAPRRPGPMQQVSPWHDRERTSWGY
jgi:RNA polymerase sigma-70 factor (ECF subfamily)